MQKQLQNLSIAHPLVIDMAKNLDIDKYSAMAILTAQECGIHEHEMGTYMETFKFHMDNSATAMDSIQRAKDAVLAIESSLVHTIQHSINIQNIVTKIPS